MNWISANRQIAAAFGVIVLMLIIHPTASQAQDGLVLKLSLLNAPGAISESAVSADSGRTEIAIPLGTPLYVRLELVNESDRSVMLIPSVHPGFGLVRLFVVDPQGTTTRLTTTRWEVGDRFMARKLLPSGGRVTHETFIYGRLADTAVGGRQYLFPAPGVYQLFARYSCPDPMLDVESNRVTVSVGAPIPRWEELKQAGIIEHIEGISRSEEESAKRRERLLELLGPAPGKAFTPWFETSAGTKAQAVPRVAPESQIVVEQTLHAFFAAWAAGDLPGCVKYLAADFRYNGALDRAQFRPLLDEGLVQLRTGGGRPQVSAQDVNLFPRGDTVEVTCRLTMGNDKEGMLGEQQIQLLFTRQNDTWVISRWNRLEP